MKKAVNYISLFLCILSMLLCFILPAAAAETLRSSDMQFNMQVYSAKAEGAYTGTFFKKNNSLFVTAETIEGMAELSIAIDENGNPLRMERTDETGAGAAFVVADHETYVFEEQIFYPFVEVMTDLCINVLYDKESGCAYAIPAKNIWALTDQMEEMLDNRTYSMSYWRSAQYFDAETSRFTAQVTDVGRNLFTLPSTMYKYLSGNADYESYRTALYDVMLAQVDCNIEATDSFVEELNIYKYLDIWKEAPETSQVWGKLTGPGKLVGEAAAAINDAGTVLQLEDNMTAIKFYYNIDNMNESVFHGIELIGRTGLAANHNFNKAVEDTVEFCSGDSTLTDIFLKNMDQGVLEYALNQLEYGPNATVGQFYVAMLDLIAAELSQNGFAKEQVDGIIKATSNLELQDAAKRSYHYYQSLYSTTKNLPKKVSALYNMRDTALVYMLSGHNAWKSFEFDQDLKAASAAGTKEMAEKISFLLSFGEEDFNVYQNVLNTKHTIMANQGNRQKSIYFFTWNEAKAQEIGDVKFSLEGRDADQKGLLHKYMFLHQYFQQNGMLVGNIVRNSSDKDNARVEYFTTEGLTELVIRPGNIGESVESAEIRVAEGGSFAEKQELTQYLVTLEDGTQIYRIPLPLGSSISEGTALPTETISAMAEPGYTFVEDGKVYQKIDYEATPPFDGEISYELVNGGRVRYRYNTDILYFYSFQGSWYPKIAHASEKDKDFPENLCEFAVTDETAEEYHEQVEKAYLSNRNYENASVSDIKYIKAGNTTVSYFVGRCIYLREQREITYVHVACREGHGLKGTYGDYGKEWPLTFEEFMIEAFSNIEIPEMETSDDKVLRLQYNDKIAEIQYDSEEIILPDDVLQSPQAEIYVPNYKGNDYRLIVDTDSYGSVQDFYDQNAEDCKKRFDDAKVTEMVSFTCGDMIFHSFICTYTDYDKKNVFLPIYFTELEPGAYCYIYIGDTMQYGTDCTEDPAVYKLLKNLFEDVEIPE